MEVQWIRESVLVTQCVCPPHGTRVAETQLSCGRGCVYSEPLHSWLAGGEGSSNQIPPAENSVNPVIFPNWELAQRKWGKKEKEL